MLQVNNLTLHFGDVVAYEDVSLDVNEGEICVILGSNGAGKTSLVRTLTGIYQPIKGTISFQGQHIKQRTSNHLVKLGIAHVAEGRQIFPTMTVQENLDVAGWAAKRAPSIPAKRDEMYQLFPRLKDRRKQLAGTLSGGEQQMLAIARALMTEPCLLFFDEPSLGLSPLVVAEMFNIISNLSQQGLTIVLVEQNVLASLKIANTAYVLENGRVVLSGKASDLLDNPRVKEAYLGL